MLQDIWVFLDFLENKEVDKLPVAIVSHFLTNKCFPAKPFCGERARPGIAEIKSIVDKASFQTRAPCLRHSDKALFGSGCDIPTSADLDPWCGSTWIDWHMMI